MKSSRRSLFAALLSATAASLAPDSARATTDYSTPYVFSTLAGASSIGSNDGPGAVARFYSPRAVAVDQAGNVYVADAVNDTIRKISPDGIVSTLAGTAGVFLSGVWDRQNTPADIDGTGPNARFGNPEGVAVAPDGTLYVGDKMNSVIRKITPQGVVTTWAGYPRIFGAADGTGTAARFNAPVGVALDAAGNLYVADWQNHQVRKITPAGVVTTLAGELGAFGHADGTGTAAQFVTVMYLAVDKTGNVYVPDIAAVRKITPDGVVTTIAGSAVAIGSIDGTGLAARFGYLGGIVADRAGNLFVGDGGNYTLRKITPDGVVTTVAGSAGTPGSADGTGSAARFRGMGGMAIDAADNVYIADEGNNTIRKVTPAGVVTTLAGLGLDYAIGSSDGLPGFAHFEKATQIAAGPNGSVYVADTLNHTIRLIGPTGTVQTIAGSSTANSANNEDGAGTVARFAAPGPIAVDGSGTIYVGETDNGTIRKITSSYVVSTLNPVTGDKDQFVSIGGITTDASSGVYVSDDAEHTINKISSSGVITVVAGQPGVAGATNGPATTASFNKPEGLVIDPAGAMYVADTGNHLIRKIAADGKVTTVAGAAGVSGDADGPASEARFNFPSGVGLDPDGNLFVADSSNSTIRKITPAGVVSTVAGRPGTAGVADGMGADVRFNAASVVAVDNKGKLLVSNASTIQVGQAAAAPVITTQPASQSVTAGNTAQFTVTAGGAPAPTYQWYFNGAAFSGGTATTLSFSNVRSTDAGDYTVVVTNSLGKVTSSKATLTVNAAAVTPTPTTPAPTTPAPSTGSTGGSGGGGSIGSWFVLTLAALGTARRRANRA